MRPCGCLPSYIFLGQNCVKFYEVTKRPRLIQNNPTSRHFSYYFREKLFSEYARKYCILYPVHHYLYKGRLY
jgi:hypothetical protein